MPTPSPASTTMFIAPIPQKEYPELIFQRLNANLVLEIPETFSHQKITTMSANPEAQSSSAPAATYSRSRPFWTEMISHERLTGPGSGKDTRHFVLNLRGSGLTYVPGDSLGVFGS